jgi:endonuclease/exonuclease/phosphatase family metal-dependent hydrolase
LKLFNCFFAIPKYTINQPSFYRLLKKNSMYRNQVLVGVAGLSVLSCVLLCLLLSACVERTERTDTRSQEGRLTLGTFNIAWLGDGIEDKEPRTEDEYKRVAQVIQDANPDVLGVEEIENTQAMERVLRYMRGYKCVISTSGGFQNVGLLFKESVQVEPVGEYMPLAVEPGRTRPGLVFHCKSGNFDWTMMVVHFKATSRADSTDELRTKSREWRTKQAAQMIEWKTMMLKTNPKEQDVIIVGDFNDYPTNERYPTLAPLAADSSLRFITFELPSCKRATWKAIDHILVNQSALKRFIPNSLYTVNLYSQYPDSIAAKISDHCPVLCQFNITAPDND